MVAGKVQNKGKAAEKKGVKKDIKKSSDNEKAGLVDESFEVDETERYTGECVYFNKAGGFGFLKLETSGVVPQDKVMCVWKELQSDDRWPFLYKGLKVEFGLAKVRSGKNQWSVKAKEVSAVGGEKLNIQEEIDASKEFVGDQNMRFLGNVKFYDFEKGFGYVKIQDGYDIDSEIPSEFRVGRAEINAGHDAPRLRNDMEVEFGIMKNKKGVYSCYNVTLPGGDNITRDFVDGREHITPGTFQGEVTMWAIKGGYGWIQPANVSKFPKKHQEALKEDAEKRKKKAEKNGKKETDGTSLYFRTGDKVDYTQRMNRGDKVTFKVYIDSQGVGACEVSLA